MDDTFPRFCNPNKLFRPPILLSHQWCDARLEPPTAGAGYNQGENKQSNRGIAVYGMAEMIIMIWPSMAIATLTQTVL